MTVYFYNLLLDVWKPVCASVSPKLLDCVCSPSKSTPLGARHPHQVLHRGFLLVRAQGQVLKGNVFVLGGRRFLRKDGLVQQRGDVHLTTPLHLLDC